jgi:5-methylcytosine-specific restriction endonuclease McrA
MRMKKLLLSVPVVRSGLYCEYCGVDLLSHQRLFESFVLDHLVPRSRGGVDAAENRRVACSACDRLKGNADVQSVEEARAYLLRFRIGLDRWFDFYRNQLRGQSAEVVRA